MDAQKRVPPEGRAPVIRTALLWHGVPSILRYYSAIFFGDASVEIEVKQVVPAHLIEWLTRVSFYRPGIVGGDDSILVRVAD